MHARIMLIYDSVTNSVFESQVLKPLTQQQQESLVVITFEPLAKEPLIDFYRKKYPSINFKIYKRWPFIGTINLYLAAYCAQRFLRNFTNYTIIARGPLAGFIAQRASKSATKIIIQARGLLAQEYAYQQQENFTGWHRWRYRLFNNLEKKVYGTLSDNHHIQAVSPALKDFLIQTYQTPAEKITVAQCDIPAIYAAKEIATWRHHARQLLNISPDAFVYCYNGSAKPWQMPAQSLDFFINALHKNPKSFLLILTQDVAIFNNLMRAKNIPEHSYRLLNVAHEDIYYYLAAADAGLLLRQSHIINWISRPTKALEYQAIGLPIIHNNTIAWLVQRHT